MKQSQQAQHELNEHNNTDTIKYRLFANILPFNLKLMLSFPSISRVCKYLLLIDKLKCLDSLTKL